MDRCDIKKTGSGRTIVSGETDSCWFEISWNNHFTVLTQAVRPKTGYENPEPTKGKGCGRCLKHKHTFIDLIRGAIGLTKAELGFDPAPPTVIAQRKAVCMTCPKYDFGVCSECGCYTAAKITIAHESCPDEHW